MRTSFLTALFCISALTAFAASPTADELLADAKTKAASENKAIFVHFSASWCIWCKRLEELLERSDFKPAFEKHFIPVKFVVQEKGKEKKLENPGGEKLLKKLGGEGVGIPFTAFLDRGGKLIVNSMRPIGNGRSENIGYPGGSEQLNWFISMIKKADPNLPQDDLNSLEASLKKPAK